jgi:anaerobic dimethyl sulfoxide reductase subunit B (iron-sulfur subunit)
MSAKQYGFYFDIDRCVRCHTCEVACASIHNLEPGTKWRRVVEVWSGEFPYVTRAFFSRACMHCAKPACESVCPTGAISKRTNGIVLVDRDLCNGCQECLLACPYDVPQFGADGSMQKCDFCVERNMEPACAAHCPTGALYYGTIDELPEPQNGKVAEKMSGITEPSIVVLHKPGSNPIQDMFVS